MKIIRISRDKSKPNRTRMDKLKKLFGEKQKPKKEEKTELTKLPDVDSSSAGRNPFYSSEMSDRDKELLASNGIKIIGTLGEGAYGTVYEGISEDLPPERSQSDFDKSLEKSLDKEQIKNKNCAVKYLRFGEQVDIDTVQKEFLALHEIVHPNVVYMHTCFFIKERSAVIIMELADFGSLGTFIYDIYKGKRDKMTQKQFEYFARGIVNALEAIHESGRGHKDIHSGNVLIFKDKENGFRGKIADFGIAQLYKQDDDTEREKAQRMDRNAMWKVVENIVRDNRLVVVEDEEWQNQMLDEFKERLQQNEEQQKLLEQDLLEEAKKNKDKE